MNEQKLIKKQLIKNMLITFVVFTIILAFFDAIIFNQVIGALYKSIDQELKITAQKIEGFEFGTDKKNSKPNNNEFNFFEIKMNPRLMYIIRNSNGLIINSETMGKNYDEYLEYITFDKNVTNKIYSIKVQDSYLYRIINVKLNNEITGEDIYVQLLANVDGEMQTRDRLIDVLVIGSGSILIIAIVCSYAISKKTLKPILESYKKQTEFVQNASHELRTPLTIIQAKEELLLQEPKSKIIDKSEDINIILKETKRLTKLIKELMVLTMADTNELKLSKEKINIDNLIKEVCIPYMEFAKMQNKEIKLDLKYNKEILVDTNRINQLMVILLDNAIKYTTEKEDIAIKTYTKDSKCIIEVQDTGIGINKESLKHIFDRFYREDKARTRETGGTGLRTCNCSYNSYNAWR